MTADITDDELAKVARAACFGGLTDPQIAWEHVTPRTRSQWLAVAAAVRSRLTPQAPPSRDQIAETLRQYDDAHQGAVDVYEESADAVLALFTAPAASVPQPDEPVIGVEDVAIAYGPVPQPERPTHVMLLDTGPGWPVGTIVKVADWENGSPLVPPGPDWTGGTYDGTNIRVVGGGEPRWEPAVPPAPEPEPSIEEAMAAWKARLAPEALAALDALTPSYPAAVLDRHHRAAPHGDPLAQGPRPIYLDLSEPAAPAPQPPPDACPTCKRADDGPFGISSCSNPWHGSAPQEEERPSPELLKSDEWFVIDLAKRLACNYEGQHPAGDGPFQVEWTIDRPWLTFKHEGQRWTVHEGWCTRVGEPVVPPVTRPGAEIHAPHPDDRRCVTCGQEWPCPGAAAEPPVTQPEPGRLKRTDVPESWADDPEAWWGHVADCRWCATHFERPAAAPVTQQEPPPLSELGRIARSAVSGSSWSRRPRGWR